MSETRLNIYQAPLQGFTDFIFRNALAEVFGGIDKFFIPYLSYGKGREIKKSLLGEVFRENHSGLNVVPQVLFSDQAELFSLAKILTDFGYPEINLNLGCPYPMATNRGRGAAWLEKPEALNEALQKLFTENLTLRLSVKMRAGMTSDREALRVFEVLNQFPLEEVIFHPRTAGQMYDGQADPERFVQALSVVKHRLVYNGDIDSLKSFQKLHKKFPDQSDWMIGRGLLMHPWLAATIKNGPFEAKELTVRMLRFHDRMFESYSERLEGAGHILMKMTRFWTYLSQSFDDPHQVRKLVKKAANLNKYQAAVTEIFRNYATTDFARD
jgi:tRNA-dihydrouridine synthase